MQQKKSTRFRNNTSPNMNEIKQPKVGLALSGASSRSVFYIGFLEVLKENDYPIDYIAAMSGATIVAASFGCKTMDQLKKFTFKMNREVLLSFMERSQSSGGLFHLRKFEELVRLYTKNYNFEDVSPRMGFVTTDLNSKSEVVLQVGDLAKAICASCALPVVFQPQAWGNKLLVDGGIINVVPGDVARAAGTDVVIGIDLRSTRHVFSPWQIFVRKQINKVKSWLWPKQAQELHKKLINKIKYSEFWQNYFYIGRYHEPALEDPRLWNVINKSLDIAIEAQQAQKKKVNFDCDYLITKELSVPFWKRALFVRFLHVDNMQDYYKAGRETALEHLPALWQLLKDKQVELAQQDEQLKQLLN